MIFLFNSKFAPLTNHIGFIKGDLETILLGIIEWLEWLPKTKRRGLKYKTEPFTDNFEGALSLFDIFNIFDVRKRLIFETDGKWVGYIDNNWRGPNISSLEVVSQRIKMEYIGFKAWEYNFSKLPIANGWGGGGFTYINANGLERGVQLSPEGSKWEFHQYGEPFSFEDISLYKKRPIKDRLTPEILDSYAKEFGVDFFNEDFYLPKGSKAYVIRTRGQKLDGEEDLSLEEVRKRLELE